MAEDWSVSGSYMEACNCEAACPCVMLSPPTSVWSGSHSSSTVSPAARTSDSHRFDHLNEARGLLESKCSA